MNDNDKQATLSKIIMINKPAKHIPAYRAAPKKRRQTA